MQVLVVTAPKSGAEIIPFLKTYALIFTRTLTRTLTNPSPNPDLTLALTLTLTLTVTLDEP